MEKDSDMNFKQIEEYILNIPAVANTAFAKAFDGGWVYGFIKSMSPVDLLLSF